MKFYKIRDKTTGLYSVGGAYILEPKYASSKPWNKNGKTWSTFGAVMNHLSQYLNYHNYDHRGSVYKCLIPDSWELIEHIIEEKDDGFIYNYKIYNAKKLILERTGKKIV